MASNPLTLKQTAFVNAYLTNGGNATEAAIAAGYSAKTARQAGARLLTNDNIEQYIENFKAEMEKKTGITIERVVQELARIGLVDIGDVIDNASDTLKVKDLADLPKDVRVAIAEIQEVEGPQGTRRILKMHSKIEALNLLLKHLGGFAPEKSEVTINPPDLSSLTDAELIQLRNLEAKTRNGKKTNL
ncbi:MAG: terminase small subunit [Bacteroidota bacterium]